MVVAPEAADFKELGIHPLLLPALDADDITVPTEIQRAAFDAIMSDRDTVLLSETGTGKTLSYALPLMHRLLLAQEADAEQLDDADWAGRRRGPANQALVLVPNKDLVAQVRSVFCSLLDALPAERRQSLSISTLGDARFADNEANILISTPASAIREWRGPEFIRWVILDEADALLAGSFKLAARANYPIEILIRDVKRTAKLEALAQAEADGKWGVSARPTKPQEGRAAGKGMSGREARAEAFYASKQFVLVGATMPNAGTKNAQEHVKRLFPTAAWYKASRVHQSKAEMQHYFVRVDEDARGAALRQALKHGPSGQALVFANSLPQAEEAFAEVVEEVGEGAAMLFHKDVPVDERAAILEAYDAGRLKVLVCTGLASRGLDFRDVAHVVQYDVASNAVEYMHRVGRTARAGKAGVTTTLYSDLRNDLVEGLRDAMQSNQPIEHLFSRKRSFKLGIKKKMKAEGTWLSPEERMLREIDAEGPY